MTSGACLVTRQMEVSPIKMNMGRSRFGGSFVPMSMFLWAGPTASVIIFKPKCWTSPLVSLSASDSTWPKPRASLHQNIQTYRSSVIQQRFNEPLLYVRQVIEVFSSLKKFPVSWGLHFRGEETDNVHKIHQKSDGDTCYKEK